MRKGHVVLSLALLALGFVLGHGLEAGRVPAAAPAVEAGPLPVGLKEDELENIRVFQRASSAVVSIRTVALRYDFFSLDVMEIPQGTGSGFVWDRKGHVVTNFHVIEGGNAFLVTLADQSVWEAEVVGAAPEKDLAVLRIKAPAGQLVPLTLGRSDDLVVGQKVLALGNPFGFDQSLTVGVLSALGRDLATRGGRTVRGVLQTDAAINPGNSGGPLLDSNGRLVGVNTAIYSPTRASAGIGFSIPVDTVGRVVPQLIERGRLLQPGIGIVPLEDWIARRYNLEGVVIREVPRGSPAQAVGLVGIRTDRYGRPVFGDVIVEVDGQRVRSTGEMLDLFETRGVGGTVALTVEREGRQRRVTVELVALD